MNGPLLSPQLSVAQAMQPVRAAGRIAIRFKALDQRTVIADLAEAGGYRAKFPASDVSCEAVIINTGGGMTGGDTLTCAIHAEASTHAVITSQSAEKLYRSSGADTQINIDLIAGNEARLNWLPQEMILFSGARLHRQFAASIAADSHLLIAESVVFGRVASTEILEDGYLLDRWRIRRGGKLVFADDMRLDGHLDKLLRRSAVMGQGRAMSTILFISPDAEQLCETVRSATEDMADTAGASFWNGMLLARCVHNNPARLRSWVVRVATILHGGPMPRVWQC